MYKPMVLKKTITPLPYVDNVRQKKKRKQIKESKKKHLV